MMYRLLVTPIEVDDHPVIGKDYLHFGVIAHNKIYLVK